MSHRPSLIDIDMMIYDIIINGISLSRSISLTEYPFFSTYQYMDYNMVIEHHISKGPRKRQFSTLPCNLPFWSVVPQNVVDMNILMTGFIHVNGKARCSWNTWFSTEMSAGIELHEHGRGVLAQQRSFLWNRAPWAWGGGSQKNHPDQIFHCAEKQGERVQENSFKDNLFLLKYIHVFIGEKFAVKVKSSQAPRTFYPLHSVSKSQCMSNCAVNLLVI